MISILLVTLLGIVFPQALFSAETIDRGVADPAVSDTLVVSDTLAVSKIPAVSDTLAVSNVPVVSETHAVGDTISISDTLAAGNVPAFSDTLVVSDSLRVSDTLAVSSDTIAVSDTLFNSSATEERIDEIQRRIQQIRSRDLGRSQDIPRLGFPMDAEITLLRRQHEEENNILRLTWMIRLLESMDDPASAAHHTIIVQDTRGVGDESTVIPRDPVIPPETYQLPADTTGQIRVDTLLVTRTDTVFVDRIQTEIIELQKMLETGVFRAFSIVFEFDRAEIMPPSHRILNEVGQLLIDNPEIRIEVQGHTDNIGPREYNMNLSKRRAESVRIYLLENFPEIEQNRIRTAGFGPDMPVTDNDSPTQRALNRRVEFIIIDHVD
jgi:outer membrane protein OmpA-like peptidoglycan-associated protein